MNRDTIKQLYHGMLRIRMVEEAIAARYSEQEMRCPVHLSIGQEAVAVGVCANLTPHDYAMSGHRSHAHYLAKGGSLTAMLAEIYGKVTGCSRGKGGSMHLVDLAAGFLGATPIVGSTIPIAVGAAFGSVMKGETRVSVAFLGEGATEEGVFHESLDFAVLKNLPVVFVCENNLYSVYSPLSVRQASTRTIWKLAAAHGMESHHVDGNDVVAVSAAMRHAVEKAKGGGGPTFFEFSTYRWREHCGPNYDNDIGYRTVAEYEAWKTKCPIARVDAGGQVTLSERAVMETALTREIEEAFAFAKSSPFPDASELLKNIYAP